ncbi:MAG: hypothetical protein A2845_06300 [Candidatus Lloydbacteria bacterium RIFCSPHIGHO2_01_FULL_49_22]|uniref:Phosphatidic acid phosphatase type 2/haloperoxidase domain-containing protein n=1 Tax=Candidatus Lloydbacteria bacterium RIFCSPHIGHO2_01_FULL_49_22 TaxID=1798658 RepID=A0A1G2CU73_9BACT|nr:MAG: hypothetical protein A2845_06300 [Candidatus Lloydbacteria bacterium RIFCSPHIGHO2_01_FULL_49_22]OGZ09458.1 MAG: hypothetical protein A3C14_00495 [Candidatus Lloydbacteria bacterium RIFCSPHIGHO2_02_FULL_50_18]
MSMIAIHEKIFFVFYDLFGPASYLSGVTIFFAEWFPYILVTVALIYELFIRNEGEVFRSMLRIYIPPLIVLSITEVFKHYFPYPRPFAALEIPPSIIVHDPFGSFPSSHAAFFAALGITMYFCNKKLGKWFLVGAVLIGIARIGVGVHWPIDIFAGLLIGVVLGFLIEKISLLISKDRMAPC